jgi:hypothetical protein
MRIVQPPNMLCRYQPCVDTDTDTDPDPVVNYYYWFIFYGSDKQTTRRSAKRALLL